jgi:hypothetical protein
MRQPPSAAGVSAVRRRAEPGEAAAGAPRGAAASAGQARQDGAWEGHVRGDADMADAYQHFVRCDSERGHLPEDQEPPGAFHP